MFIAMNRFKVRKGSEHDFEQVWLTRQSHLEEVPGFVIFHLLKGPEKDDHVLYACASCGTIYTNARQSEEVRELYDHYYDVEPWRTLP